MNARRNIAETRLFCFTLEECFVTSGFVNNSSILMASRRVLNVSEVSLQFHSGFIEKNVGRKSMNLFIIQLVWFDIGLIWWNPNKNLLKAQNHNYCLNPHYWWFHGVGRQDVMNASRVYWDVAFFEFYLCWECA